MTAAQCINSRPLPEFVRLGHHNLKNDAEGVDYEIEKFIRHPDYNSRTRNDDIALLKLQKDVM